MVDVAIIAVIITAVIGTITTLIGIEYRNLKSRISDIESDSNCNSEKYNTIRSKVNTLWKWAFGVPDDETDTGLSGEIQSGFNKIEEDIEETQRKQETYHEVEMDYLEKLITELHHAESLKDLTRDDLEDRKNK